MKYFGFNVSYMYKIYNHRHSYVNYFFFPELVRERSFIRGIVDILQ